MPQISIIRDDGTGDYTTLQAWASAEGDVNYGVMPVARIDGFFNFGSANLDFISSWPNGARLECFNPDNAFNGTRRMLCGVTSTATQSVRNRGKNIEMEGLELYNAGTGTPYWNTSSDGTFKADNCLFKDNNPASGAALAPSTSLGDGLTNCVIDSAARGYSPPIRMNKCTVLANSGSAVGTTSGEKIISNTVVANKLSGQCFRPEVTQTNCASTDNTAFAYPLIVVADEFVNADPAASGIYHIKGDSTIGVAEIGAFIEQGDDNEKPVITLFGDNPLTLPFGTSYVEPGYQAIDQEDGDITVDVIVSGIVDENIPGPYTIFYNVTDSQGLAADEVFRLVEVSDPPNQKPVITLLGDNPLNIPVGTPYVEPGYTATDAEDGDLTSNVMVTGAVDYNEAGQYVLSYNVLDSQLVPADEVTRIVNVIEVSSSLNMAMQNVPDGLNATRVINPIGGGSLLLYGMLEWQSGEAVFQTDLPAGSVLHYYVLNETVDGFKSGINIGVTQ